LKSQLVEKNARLTVVWVLTDIDVVKDPMIQRNSSRDTWKLEHWDEYIKGVDFSIPQRIDNPEVIDDLLLFRHSNEDEYRQSMREVLSVLEAGL
jgi:hypothetical protein